MSENWMVTNSRVYDEFREKGSSLVADIDKPFFLLACRLYGIMLEPLSRGEPIEKEFVGKQTYILRHFQSDYERMKSMGKLGNPEHVRLFERQAGLYGEPDASLTEEEEGIARAMGSSIRRSMRYIYVEDRWGLIWDFLESGALSLEDFPVESVPEISEEAIELLRVLRIETYSQLADFMYNGVNETLDNIVSLAADKFVRMEFQDIVNKSFL